MTIQRTFQMYCERCGSLLEIQDTGEYTYQELVDKYDWRMQAEEDCTIFFCSACVIDMEDELDQLAYTNGW